MSSILNIAAGEPISGPGIPVGATVVSLGTTQFIATTASSTTLTMVSPATTTGLGLTVGEPLTGIGIAPGATITAIASGTITMSTAASSSNTGITIYAGTVSYTHLDVYKRQPPYVYGSPSPNLNALGTITGVDSTVTAKFVSGASQFSPVSGSPYPITVGFSGGDFCNYLSPTTGAFVTETPAPLSEWVPPITAPFGSPNINFALDLVYTGAVNNDQNAITPLFSVAPLNVTTVSGSAVLTVVAGGGNTGAATAGSVITGPVSYTHLDVYKRQSPCRSTRQ